jgi:hypothetical protein
MLARFRFAVVFAGTVLVSAGSTWAAIGYVGTVGTASSATGETIGRPDRIGTGVHGITKVRLRVERNVPGMLASIGGKNGLPSRRPSSRSRRFWCSTPRPAPMGSAGRHPSQDLPAERTSRWRDATSAIVFD